MIRVLRQSLSGATVSAVVLLGIYTSPVVNAQQQQIPLSGAPQPAPPSPQKKTIPQRGTSAEDGALRRPGTPDVQPRPQPPTTKAAPATWRVRISEGSPTTISLRAKDASLADVVADISRRIDAPIVLSKLMSTQKLTLGLNNATLENAMRQLAPQAYVDYLVTGDPAAQPKIVAVYLHGLNEPPPAASIAVRSNSEAIVIEGNTDETIEAQPIKPDEKPLVVTYEKNRLSVQARKQPLTAVLYEIATKIDVPFDMQYESSEIVDANFKNYSLEDAARSLSPSVNLYVRTDLLSYETKPLRIVLVQATKT